MENKFAKSNGNGKHAFPIELDGKSESSSSKALKDRIKFLEKENRQFVQTLEESPDAIIQLNELLAITFTNNAAERLLGYSSAEVVGENISVIIPGGANVNGNAREVEAKRKDGNKVWVHLSFTKTEVDNDVVYTAFIKDISQIKNVQKEQQRTVE